MYSTGNSGDPCGNPADVLMGFDLMPLNWSCVLLPCKKLLTQCTISAGTRLIFRLWIRQTLMVYIVERSCHIHKYCREHLFLFPCLVYAFRQDHHRIFCTPSWAPSMVLC